MYREIINQVQTFSENAISQERKHLLRPLTQYIQSKKEVGLPVYLTFICTHNSRRSHFSQVWAQTMAFYFNVPIVYCYSGGTETTAIYSSVINTLANQGFKIIKLSDSANPIYAIRYNDNAPPIIGFSKNYTHDFNPKNNFGAIMTCDSANEACPIVSGADARFSIEYKDPKMYDYTELQEQKYLERSLEIAQEMWWVFKNIR
jgi:arsenate reductase